MVCSAGARASMRRGGEIDGQSDGSKGHAEERQHQRGWWVFVRARRVGVGVEVGVGVGLDAKVWRRTGRGRARRGRGGGFPQTESRARERVWWVFEARRVFG